MDKRKWPPTLVRGPHSSSHPYPLEIALRAQIFTVGAIFYVSFADAAVEEFLHLSTDPYGVIRKKFLETGLSPENWEENWRAFIAYTDAFPSPVFQTALFSMITHWDWYISNLGRFVDFAHIHGTIPAISNKIKGELHRIGRKPISEQIIILEKATGLQFDLPGNVVNQLIEMNLVRNLGMHNQWAVDDDYLKYSLQKHRAVGSLREVTPKDLEGWQQAVLKTINTTSSMIAKGYVNAPDYKPS